MKKVIILGANGMAGHVITAYFRSLLAYQVIAVARTQSIISPDVLLDVTDFEQLDLLIKTEKPDYIINAIGILNEVAERKPDLAILINSYLPHFLESITRNTTCKIIHISTDCVFSGKKGGYIETDFKDGKGFYAQSKALGEIVNDKDITLRTSIIGPEINESGIGLFHWFMQQGGTIKGYTKAVWAGVTTMELAKAVERAIDQNTVGLYHVTNQQSINKYDLLNIFKKYTHKIIEISPVDGVVSDKSFIDSRKEFDYQIPTYEVMVKEMIDLMKNNKALYAQYKLD